MDVRQCRYTNRKHPSVETSYLQLFIWQRLRCIGTDRAVSKRRQNVWGIVHRWQNSSTRVFLSHQAFVVQLITISRMSNFTYFQWKCFFGLRVWELIFRSRGSFMCGESPIVKHLTESVTSDGYQTLILFFFVYLVYVLINTTHVRQ